MNEPDSALPLPKRRWAAISIATGLVVTILDGSMVIVMLPVVAETFSVEPSRAIWVMTAYQLTMTCLLLQSAAIGEKYGQWRVYCSGLALFACASLVCAFSTSLSGLIFGRVLQGIGAAGVHSMTMALLRHSYPRSLFGRAAGFNSSVVGLSMAAGPSVGALILHFTDWRGLFLVTFPVAAFSLIAGLGALPRLGRPRFRRHRHAGHRVPVHGPERNASRHKRRRAWWISRRCAHPFRRAGPPSTRCSQSGTSRRPALG